MIVGVGSSRTLPARWRDELEFSSRADLSFVYPQTVMLIDKKTPPIPLKTASTPLEDAHRLVTTYISTSATQIPTELLQCQSFAYPPSIPSFAFPRAHHGFRIPFAFVTAVLEEDKIGLLTLVKALGEYLTSTDDGVRARGEHDSSRPTLRFAFLSPLELTCFSPFFPLQLSVFSRELWPRSLRPRSTGNPVSSARIARCELEAQAAD